MRSTKIVATIGPASRSLDVLERMIRAGMDVARLNFAHETPEEHAETVTMIRQASERVGREVAVLQDVPGPKLRIGPVQGGVTELGTGTRVVLTPERIEGNAQRLPVAWPGIAEIMHEGDVAYLADGAIRLRVDEVSNGEVVTEVEVGGTLASRQGLNLPNVTTSLPAVSEEDLRLIDAGVEMGIDLRIEEVPLVQKRLLQLAGKYSKPAITATQMLESMVHSSRPTRAEVTDVSNAIFDGTDAVMLSQETAIGRYPVEAVAMMASIAETTERELPYGRWLTERGKHDAQDESATIAFGAVGAVYQLGLKALVAPTITGRTAALMSAHRPIVPVLALTPRHDVVRR